MSYLLSIRLSDGREFTKETNNSTATAPIELPNADESFANIKMLVPTNTNSIALISLIGAPYNYWDDDDGDGIGSEGIAITGSLNLSMVDKYNKTVDRNQKLTICNAPYKITLTSTNGTLRTKYGIPNSSNFNNSSTIYYITPKVKPTVCYAKPNLRYGSNKETEGWAAGKNINFGGPDSVWNSSQGFITQSANPSSYKLNFPTTGAHNLYFDLEIKGSSDRLIWTSVTQSGITANIKHNNSTGTSVRVTLFGPVASSSQWNSSSPGRIAKPALPLTFELVGRDTRNIPVVKYGFQLQKWFVNRGPNRYGGYSEVSSWCTNIGYRLPKVSDLTNAVCSGTWAGEHCQGGVGATPSSSGEHYQRVIGAGFFSEWGYMADYLGANFDYIDYWTSDLGKNQLKNHLIVHAGPGYIWWSGGDIHYNVNVVCATP
ncbi:hypothetical protein [Gilliamella apis]|uniref:hypothetical protein n=1 Tax=Gilliamella apis TaxID=1970738 RepID=UPI00080E1F3B|nr:hypothetical protein [Gilliamella apis]OCG06280.1 hypothetical protein A9G19_03015 [Gilliamella apis]